MSVGMAIFLSVVAVCITIVMVVLIATAAGVTIEKTQSSTNPVKPEPDKHGLWMETEKS